MDNTWERRFLVAIISGFIIHSTRVKSWQAAPHERAAPVGAAPAGATSAQVGRALEPE